MVDINKYLNDRFYNKMDHIESPQVFPLINGENQKQRDSPIMQEQKTLLLH